LDTQTCLQHSANATYQVVAGEAILIHMKSGVYYSLNEVGTAFWQLMDGRHSIADCAKILAAEYAAPVEVIQEDLTEVATDLVRENLAEVAA
jgi:Coenzyme PQQ synthesis protein D (PqqD)